MLVERWTIGAISKARDTLTRTRPAVLSRTGATLDRATTHDFACDVSTRSYRLRPTRPSNHDHLHRAPGGPIRWPPGLYLIWKTRWWALPRDQAIQRYGATGSRFARLEASQHPKLVTLLVPIAQNQAANRLSCSALSRTAQTPRPAVVGLVADPWQQAVVVAGVAGAPPPGSGCHLVQGDSG